MISVSLFGAGKVAKNLARIILENPEVELVQWFNKNPERLKQYQNTVDVVDNLSALKPVDVYILAIKDDAIAEFSSELPFKNRLVVHTSGSVNIHDLDRKLRRGVFYPLQTFSEESNLKPDEIPICLEALEKDDYKLLMKFSDALGFTPYKISTEQRQTLHLSAVFVNNFVNQLYRIAHEISDAKKIDFNILKPLIFETSKKISRMSPYQAQTGPAIRGDKKTMKKHLKLIEDKEHKKIYELMTHSIKTTHGR